MIVVHHAGTTFTCDHMSINEEAHTASFFCSYWRNDNQAFFAGVRVCRYEVKPSYLEVFLEKYDEKNSGC